MDNNLTCRDCKLCLQIRVFDHLLPDKLHTALIDNPDVVVCLAFKNEGVAAIINNDGFCEAFTPK